MIRFVALVAASAAALAIPAVASAQTDPALAAFQSLCWNTADDYLAIKKAATAAGWGNADVTAPDEDGVSVTDKAAMEKPAEGGGRLTLLVSRGLRKIGGADYKVVTCKISHDKGNPGLIAAAKTWVGSAPDNSDPTLAIYYVGLASGTPNHVGKAGMGAAIAGAGLSILKFQQDSNATIVVDQSYSK
jgi:hypothetical protein